MRHEEFLAWSQKAAEWGAEYRKTLEGLPVRPNIQPGSTRAQLAPSPPQQGEGMDAIFADFERIIMPGITHWQHPRFFAYFPSNAMPPAVISDYLVAALGTQSMLWQTSPAATELDTLTLDWLRQALDLADHFKGTYQDGASSSTLSAILVMRERALEWQGKTRGLAGQKQLRVYVSKEAHSSVERAVWVSGIGGENLVKIDAAHTAPFSMDLALLEERIEADVAAGFLPCGIVACVGGTSIGACDDISAICALARKYNLYVHVDAAWAGSAMLCEEFRHLWAGIDEADSIVVNPHKWLGVPLDCSVHWVKEPELLLKTLAIRPEYLKSYETSDIVNYSEWTIALGRRFRSLKIWFLLRYYGLEGLQTMIRNHVEWAGILADMMRGSPLFEIVTTPVLSLFTFRMKGSDEQNLAMLNAINQSGDLYLTQTLVKGRFAIRFQAGSHMMRREDVDIAFAAIEREAKAAA